MSFPIKEERQKCWDSRDRYWQCLDTSGDQNNKCVELRTLYETTCPSQWVSWFTTTNRAVHGDVMLIRLIIHTPPCQTIQLLLILNIDFFYLSKNKYVANISIQLSFFFFSEWDVCSYPTVNQLDVAKKKKSKIENAAAVDYCPPPYSSAIQK